MAASLDNLEGHVGEVLLDLRPFTDPWGWQISGLVMRNDHIEWQQFELTLASTQPAAQRVRRSVSETVFVGLAPASGYRQKKKPSKAEAYNRLIDKVSQRDEVKIDLVSLREKKEGIARILCPHLTFKGETEVTRRGQTFDLATPEGRSGFLDHRLWQTEKGGGQVEQDSIPLFKRDAEGEIIMDADDEPEENELGGMNIGDAVAQLIVNKSEELGAFVQERKAVVSDLSGGTGSGSTATGSPLPPAGEES